MQYWLLRTAVLSKPNFEVKISGRRVPRVRAGDRIVLYDRRNGEIEFWGEASVKSGPDSRDNVHMFVLHSLEKYVDSRPLRWFRFSLHKVYRFFRPSVHFVRAYGRLHPDDYGALHSDTPEVVPTTVGTLLETLDRQSVLEAFHEALATDDRLSIEAFEQALRNQIKAEFVTPATQLGQALNLAREIVGPEQAADLGYDDETTRPPRRSGVNFSDMQKVYEDVAQAARLADDLLPALRETDAAATRYADRNRLGWRLLEERLSLRR